MHTWLFEHRQDLTEESLSAAAAELGFGAAMLLAAMEQSEVQDNIQDDIDAAKKLPVLRYGTPPGLHSIPTVFVNGRHIPRWELGDQPVLETILKEAAQ
jgi:2-hydroxychromene-2-carboxylate isomerase